MSTKMTPDNKRHDLIIQLTHEKFEGQSVPLSDDRLLQVLTELTDKVGQYTGSKLLEMHLIELLCSRDTYIKDEFTPEEVMTIRNNIASDFPIFLNTHIGDLQQMLSQSRDSLHSHEAAIETRNTRINDLEKKVAFLEAHSDQLLNVLIKDDGVIDLNNHYSPERIIIAKAKAGISLTPSEVKKIESYLITKF